MTLSDALQICGFTVVRLAIPSNEDNNGSPSHCLYLKEHSIKKYHSSKPEKRTLLVCNVPPYLNEAAIKDLFQSSGCGVVQKVFLHLKPEVGDVSAEEAAQFSTFFPNTEDCIYATKYAYVVFRQPNGVSSALSLPHDKPLVLANENMVKASCLTGVEKWCHEYRHSTVDFDLSALEKDIERYVSQFDQKKKEDQLQEKMEEQADDEGWVKVSRKRGARFTEAEQQHQHRREKKRKEETELVHFYRFQLRESRREKIAELRKRFEEDKQRIALLREQRKFRPF